MSQTNSRLKVFEKQAEEPNHQTCKIGSQRFRQISAKIRDRIFILPTKKTAACTNDGQSLLPLTTLNLKTYPPPQSNKGVPSPTIPPLPPTRTHYNPTSSLTVTPLYSHPTNLPYLSTSPFHSPSCTLRTSLVPRRNLSFPFNFPFLSFQLKVCADDFEPFVQSFRTSFLHSLLTSL